MPDRQTTALAHFAVVGIQFLHVQATYYFYWPALYAGKTPNRVHLLHHIYIRYGNRTGSRRPDYGSIRDERV